MYGTYIFSKVLKLDCERLIVKLRTKEAEHICLGTPYLITTVFLRQTTRKQNIFLEDKSGKGKNI